MRIMPTLGEQARLWRLVSPLLPVGAYHHSQGLEQAVARRWVRDEDAVREWLADLLEHVLIHVDLPILIRAREAWMRRDAATLRHWNAVCLACRESRELRDEERNMGAALGRLLGELQEPAPAAALGFVASFGVAAANANIDAPETAAGYAWSWCENQVSAAIRLVPIGQSAGQCILRHLGEGLDAVVAAALAVADDDVGRSAPGLAIASALHETQQTRLFRS